MEDKVILEDARKTYEILKRGPEQLERKIQEGVRTNIKEAESLIRTLENDFMPPSFNPFREHLEMERPFPSNKLLVGYSKRFSINYDEINWGMENS